MDAIMYLFTFTYYFHRRVLADWVSEDIRPNPFGPLKQQQLLFSAIFTGPCGENFTGPYASRRPSPLLNLMIILHNSYLVAEPNHIS